MIRLTDDRRKVGGVALGAIWLGNSNDESSSNLDDRDVKAVLNVAQDMPATRGWAQGLEYMHIGLVDGPGNEPITYAAAVLALHALLKRHNVLVCCHSGVRSLAVIVLYLTVTSDIVGWTWLDCLERLRERVDCDLPNMNHVHVEAINKIPETLLQHIMRNK